MAKVVFLIQMLPIFGGCCNRYFWDIRLEILGLPNFNMLFQLVLQNFSKVNCFRVYRKLITWSSHAKSLLGPLLRRALMWINSHKVHFGWSLTGGASVCASYWIWAIFISYAFRVYHYYITFRLFFIAFMCNQRCLLRVEKTQGWN